VFILQGLLSLKHSSKRFLVQQRCHGRQEWL